MSNFTNSSLPSIPERWMISPLDPADRSHCPAVSATMLTFLITNIITAILGLPLGCRLLVAKLTFNRFGTRPERDNGPFKASNPSRWYMWTIPFTLQVLANLSIAIMIKRTPGYEHTSIPDIMLLYFFRPRLSWVLQTIMSHFAVFQHSRSTFRLSKPGFKSLKDTWEYRNSLWYDGRDLESPWQSSAFNSAIAEIILQIIAVIYIEVTWSRSPHSSGGALTYMILFSYALPFLVLQCLGGVWAVAFISYGIMWAFFALMVVRAGDLWCPPKLTAHAGIWISYTLVGIFSSSG